MNDDDRAVVGFTALAHATFHTYELAIPIFVTVWLDAFTVSPAVLGGVVAAGYALVGVGALPSGVLADAYGSQTLVATSIAGMGAGFLLAALAPNVAVLALALVVWGAGAGLYHPAGLSLLSRGTDERGTALAYHGAAGSVGTVVGPLAAALLLAVAEWRLVAVAFALPAAGAALAAFDRDLAPAADRPEADESLADGGTGSDAGGGSDAGTESDARTGDDAETGGDDPGGVGSLADLLASSRALFTRGFAVVFVVVTLYGLYYRGVLTFLPEILADLPAFAPAELVGREVSPSRYVYAGLLLVGLAGQYAGGTASDRVAPERLLVGAFAALVVAALAFGPAASAGVPALLAVCALLGFFVYAVAPVYQAAIADRVPPDAHGLSYGFTYLATFGVGAAGAAGAGALLTYWTAGALFGGLAGLAALAGTLSAVLAWQT